MIKHNNFHKYIFAPFWFLYNKLSYFFSYFLNRIYLLFVINKSPFKFYGINVFYYLFILSIGLISSLIVRLDFIYGYLKYFPYELILSLRLTSSLFTIFSIFLFMICIINSIRFYNKVLISKINYNLVFLYSLYFIYISFINFILFLLNYYSILSLNIFNLDKLYLMFVCLSLIFGLYYGIKKMSNEFNFNQTLTYFGKVCMFGFIITYISLFIIIRFGYIGEILNKLNILKSIECSSTPTNNTNLTDSNNNKSNDSRLSSSSTRSDSSSNSSSSQSQKSVNIQNNTNANIVTAKNTQTNVFYNQKSDESSASNNQSSSKTNQAYLVRTVTERIELGVDQDFLKT
jgi:hypothetical protein